MKSPIVVQAKDEGEAWERLYREQETTWWVIQGEPQYKSKSTYVVNGKRFTQYNQSILHKKFLGKKSFGKEAQRPEAFEKLPVLVPKEVY